MSSNAPPYHYESVDGYSVVTLHSSLNDVQWASIERIGSDLLAQIAPIKTPILMIDLSSLSYMGSAMVALVVRVWKAVNEREGRMVVVNRNEMVLEVLRLAGLANVWTIVPSREEGLNELGVRGGRGRQSGSGGSTVLAFLGLAAGGVAAVGAVAPLTMPGAPSAELARMLALGGGAVALILGTILALKGAGGSRGIGIAVVLIGLVSVGLTAFVRPHPAVPPGEPSNTDPKPAPGDGKGNAEKPTEDSAAGKSAAGKSAAGKSAAGKAEGSSSTNGAATAEKPGDEETKSPETTSKDTPRAPDPPEGKP